MNKVLFTTFAALAVAAAAASAQGNPTQAASAAQAAVQPANDSAAVNVAAKAANDSASANVAAKAANDSASANVAAKAANDSAAANVAEKAANDSASANVAAKAANDSASANVAEKAANDSASANVAAKAANDSASANVAEKAANDSASANVAEKAANDSASANVAEKAANDSAAVNVAEKAANDSAAANVEQKPAEPQIDMSMAAAGSEKKKKEPKKPLFRAGEFVFDIDASFEIQAGKVLWTSEDDDNGDNFEEWWGRANLGLETHSNDFNGRILMYMYPGDLMDNQYHARHTADGDTSDTYEYRDMFEIHEAWAEQHTKYVALKVGRWEFTQKNGDYFGNYVDGYYNGFKSGTESENALQFTFTPTETMTMDLALISTTPNLNTGDLRLMFHFHDLSGIEFLNLDLGYRTNVFDLVHDDDVDVRHTIALQGKTPIVNDIVYFFLEGALMGIDAEETYKDRFGKEHTRSIDMVAPITGGLLFTPRDYRIILEAEYIHDRYKTEYADKDKKHIKDVLAAFYIEKPLTKRFTLSFGAHSYGTSRDFEFNGNLIGKIN